MDNDNRINAYVQAFSQLINSLPGSPEFVAAQSTMDRLWEGFTPTEMLRAHDLAGPYRAKLGV